MGYENMYANEINKSFLSGRFEIDVCKLDLRYK